MVNVTGQILKIISCFQSIEPLSSSWITLLWIEEEPQVFVLDDEMKRQNALIVLTGDD